MELKIKRGTDLRLVGAVVDVETVTEVLGVHSVAIIPEELLYLTVKPVTISSKQSEKSKR